MARILVVEDDHTSRRVIERLLRLSGHDVVSADSVAAALDIVHSADSFDILLSDLLLGDATGWDLVRAIDRSKMPFATIALSGSSTENETMHSLQSGFCMHLTKPITFDRLLAAIEQCLAGRAEG